MVALLLNLSLALAPPANIAPNPSAEAGQGDLPTGWSFYSWNGSTGWWATEQAFDGDRSLGLSGLNGGWSTRFPVRPGYVYRVTFHYRAEGPASRAVVFARPIVEGQAGKAALYRPIPAIRFDEPGQFVNGDLVAGADERGWVYAEAGQFVPEAGITEFDLLLKLVSDSPESKLYLDGIAVAETPQRTAPPSAFRLASTNGLVIWSDNPNRKIGHDQAPPDTRGELAVSAAKGESEVFQVVITPDHDLTAARWRWQPLDGPGTIPADALRCRLVEFIDIQRPMGPFGAKGLCPDPLTDRLPTTMPAGRPTTCWFTLAVPADAAAGDYAGQLELVTGDQVLATVPWKLTVWPFTLPAHSRLQVRSHLRAELVLAREQGQPDDILKRYYASFFEHRTTCQPGVSPVIRRNGDQLTADATRLVEHYTFLRDTYGLDRVVLPSLWIGHRGTHRMPADATWQGLRIFADDAVSSLDPTFEQAFRRYFTGVCQTFRDAGLWLQPQVGFFDEPQLDDDATRRGLRLFCRLIHSVAQDVEITLAAAYPHPELTGEIKSWALHTDAWDDNLARIDAARQAGCRIGVYNNAVDFPEHRRLRLRLWPWLLYQYGVDATYSWWGTVCWRGPMEDPWTCGQGDSGVLLYPPREGESGPIESVRWELFREGLEDYAYLELTASLAGRAAAKLGERAAEPATQAIRQALALVEHWPNVKTASDEPYSIDPREHQAAREMLAHTIIALRHALGEDVE